MTKFETVEVPFQTVGNRQVISTLQCVRDDWIMQFVEGFPSCFEYDPAADVYVYYPDGDSPVPVGK